MDLEARKKQTRENRKNVASRLLECMEMENKKQSEIILSLKNLKHIEITSAHLSMILKGSRTLPNDYAIAISDILKIDSGYLLGADDFKYKNYKAFCGRHKSEQQDEKLLSAFRECSRYVSHCGGKTINVIMNADNSKVEFYTVSFERKNIDIPPEEFEALKKDIDTYARACMKKISLQYQK